MKMLPHVFTQSEMSDLAIDLASATQRKEAIEDRKKEANSQFKAEIDAQDAEIKRISRLISRGEELRNTEVEILFHTPEENKKTVRRLDTMEEIEVSDMTESEIQDLLSRSIGAQYDRNEFVFKNLSRVKMLSMAEWEKIKDQPGWMIVCMLVTADELQAIATERTLDPYGSLVVFQNPDAEKGEKNFSLYTFDIHAGEENE